MITALSNDSASEANISSGESEQDVLIYAPVWRQRRVRKRKWRGRRGLGGQGGPRSAARPQAALHADSPRL